MPAYSTERLLAVLVWIELVMCRPLLGPAADPAELVRHVEMLAGRVADLLAQEGRRLSSDNHVVVAAQDVLDTCCQLIERWNEPTTNNSAAFASEVEQLRARLSEIALRLKYDAVATEPKAS